MSKNLTNYLKGEKITIHSKEGDIILPKFDHVFLLLSYYDSSFSIQLDGLTVFECELSNDEEENLTDRLYREKTIHCGGCNLTIDYTKEDEDETHYYHVMETHFNEPNLNLDDLINYIILK